MSKNPRTESADVEYIKSNKGIRANLSRYKAFDLVIDSWKLLNCETLATAINLRLG